MRNITKRSARSQVLDGPDRVKKKKNEESKMALN